MTIENLRYLRKNYNQNERDNFSTWWYEYIKIYGTLCYYYVNSYSLTAHDFIYGEDPNQIFRPSAEMIILASVNDQNILLSKFGIQTDSDLTCIIHISGFREIFSRMDSSVHPYFNGAWYEPKAGDLIKLVEYGWDRPGSDSGATWTYPDSGQKTENDSFMPPGGHPAWEAWRRGGPIYEITERRDENLTMMANELIGHYVWVIKAKRFDYSFETGIEPEDGSAQISDITEYGALTSCHPPVCPKTPINNKVYDQNIEKESNKLFNYPDPGDKKSRDNRVYGTYDHDYDT